MNLTNKNKNYVCASGFKTTNGRTGTPKAWDELNIRPKALANLARSPIYTHVPYTTVDAKSTPPESFFLVHRFEIREIFPATSEK